MAIRALMRLFAAKSTHLARAEHGNTTIVFALAFIPLVGLTGAAVDYSRANAIRTAMQSAADATALAISKTASSATASSLQTEASTYFDAAFTRNDANNVSVTATYSTTGGNQVVVNASATMNTDFMGLLGIKRLPLGASSTTTWGNSRLRVALVLDNTGSMSQSGKLSALKTATKNLLTQLQNAATDPGDVYVSIIPFVNDVAVDPIDYTASWIDWTDWDANNGTCSSGSGGWGGWGGWGGGGSTKATCTGTWIPAGHNTWNGCITDRGKPPAASNKPGTTPGNDETVSAPVSTDVTTLFPADQDSSCPLQVMPLSYDWSAMTSYVNSMVANGSTNQNIGLAHGWQSLVGGGPYPTPPPMVSGYNYQQVIILLTDGLNTQDRWYGDGMSTGTTDTQTIDARQQQTCNNIHAAGITLYTVQVDTDGSPVSTLLQNCAGSPNKYPDPTKYFLLTSSSEIVATFNAIGTNLSQLRVAK